LNTETNHNNSNCITPDQLPEYSNNIPELRGSPQTATPNQCIPPFFAESLCGATQHDLSIQPWQLTQEISEELEECQQKQPNPHAIPCAFDDIGNQLVRNAYLPFVLRSPLQVLTPNHFSQNHLYSPSQIVPSLLSKNDLLNSNFLHPLWFSHSWCSGPKQILTYR